MSFRSTIIAVAIVGLALMSTGAAAKSLYVIASHNGTYSAYNINPDGTVTWQADYPSGAWGPAGMAVHAASSTLFVTYEFSGDVILVDATTMIGFGSVNAPGASDLAGIDVDDVHDVVFAVDRWTENVYAYDWDPLTTTLTLQPGYPATLTGCQGAFGIALDEMAGILYVSCFGSGGMVRGYDVATWTEVASFSPTLFSPVGIAVDRLRGYVYSTAPAGYCANSPTGNTMLSRYDLATGVESWVDMGHGGMGLAVDELTGYVYVTGGCDGDDLAVWDMDAPAMMQTTGSIGSPAGLATGNISFNPLNLTKDDSLDDGCAVPGWNIVYELCYDNLANPFDVTGVTLTDDLPIAVDYVSSTGGGIYDAVTHTVTWDLGDLPAGAPQACLDLVVSLDVTTTPASIFTNLLTIESEVTPPTTIEEETDVCPVIPVPFDIKPMSCRNPLRIKRSGVVPTAVLGAEDFDVTQVDPATLRLEGVAPLRWSFEDVETPYVPYLGKTDPYDCHAVGPDGYLDMTVKFLRYEIVEAIGPVEHRDVLVLTLTGNLLPEYGGMPILGEDVVVVILK
jgi:DNA-binding beta-propeller fold protein YncE